MIEQVTKNIMRCDACNTIITTECAAHILTKDFCSKCSCDILTEIGNNRLLDVEEFLDLLDDYKHSFKIQRRSIHEF